MDDNPYRSPQQVGSIYPAVFWSIRAVCWLAVCWMLALLVLHAWVVNRGFVIDLKPCLGYSATAIWLLFAQAWAKRGKHDCDWFFGFLLLGAVVAATLLIAFP